MHASSTAQIVCASVADHGHDHWCADCRKSKDDEVEFLAKCGSSITLFLQVSAISTQARDLHLQRLMLDATPCHAPAGHSFR
jgi:hypothetical protein